MGDVHLAHLIVRWSRAEERVSFGVEALPDDNSCPPHTRDTQAAQAGTRVRNGSMLWSHVFQPRKQFITITTFKFLWCAEKYKKTHWCLRLKLDGSSGSALDLWAVWEVSLPTSLRCTWSAAGRDRTKSIRLICQRNCCALGSGLQVELGMFG